MDTELPEDVKMIQSTCIKIREEELMPLEKVVMDLDKKGGWGNEFPKEISDKLKKRAMEVGLWCGDLPTELGGGGLSTLAQNVCTEEFMQTIAPFPRSPGIGARILLGASEEVKEKYFDRFIKGELSSSFVQSEPGAGSDVSGIQTTAVLEGDTWHINGHKLWISGADKADIAFIVAVTDKAKGTHGGISTFVVDTHQPGWKVVRKIATMGGTDFAMSTCEVLLEDVTTPKNHIVGEEGRGFAQASKFLSNNRVHMGAMYVGWGTRCLNMSTDYAKKRVTFGEPLSNRQAVQWMLVDSAIDIHATRLMVQHASWWTDKYPEKDNRQMSSMCRVFGSEMGLKVIDRSIQIHGGIGYSKDLPLEMIYRRARLFTIGEGPNEIQRYIIARNIFRG